MALYFGTTYIKDEASEKKMRMNELITEKTHPTVFISHFDSWPQSLTERNKFFILSEEHVNFIAL